MSEKADKDNQTLIDFWDKALTLSDENKNEIRQSDPESWKEMAPSEKLFEAAKALGQRKKVLDYGCGSAWAAIIAAKSGCPDVTAVDVAKGGTDAAAFYAALFGVEERLHVLHITPDWLESVPAETFDGFICSNVLDVVPTETAEAILREASRVVTPDAKVMIGLNYYLSPEMAAARGMELADGKRLYVDGVLRLVSRCDEAWAEFFAPYFEVEQLEYFAWPGEKAETRRLFHLTKRSKK